MALTIVAAAMLGAPSASAATMVTLGARSLKAPVLELYECTGCQSGALMNTAAETGAQLTAPADGTIGSWGVVGEVLGGGSLQLFVLHPATGGAVTFGSISTAAAAVDGGPNPTSLAVSAGDAIGISFSRGVDFAKEHARIALAQASSASWGEISYYQPGHEVTPQEIVAGQQLLYNATVELFSPALSAIAPNTGGAGTVVTISGQHLAVATGVTFGGVPATSFSGDDEQITAVAPAHAGGPVDVQVTTAGGTTVGLPLDVFTYPSTAVPLAPPLADRTPPGISSLSLSPTSFRAANLGGSVIARRVGTRVSDRLSEPATTTFAVQRVLAGRRSGKHCVAPSRSNRGKRRCTRLKSVQGSFTRTAAAGANSFTFTGRIGGRALSRGSYRLVATAVDAAGNRSKPAARAFAIVR